MPNKVIAVRDKGEILEFSPASLYAYCGPTQIIASALMFRLFERAFIDLSPEAPPEREDIQFLSGFPGTGIAECVELVTRIRTRRPERFRVDRGAAPREAPEAVSGVLYFEVQIKERRRGYWPPRELFDQVFRKKVSLFQDGSGTVQEQEAYLAYKKHLSAAILRRPGEGFFASREVLPKTLP
ncbi:MAG: hypothetical protein LBF75_11730 [Treponema sp.]|jgi:hypothetical protein|nr:hypothetical protein [Treponema sp.]